MNTENLNNFDIFNTLSHEEINLFTKKIKSKSYTKGDIIIKEGDPGNSLLFLLSGEINITKSLTLPTNKDGDKDNREKEFIRCKASNNIIIGEISLFTKDSKRTASINALKNCTIAFIDNKDFFDICNTNSDVGYKVLSNLIKIITEKLVNTNHQVLKLTTAFSLMMDD